MDTRHFSFNAAIYNMKKLVKTKVWFHWILQMFDSTFSFASANGNGKLFREMFQDSDIAEGYNIQLKFQCLLIDLRVLIGPYSKFY